MISVALFAISVILYMLATYWRERTISGQGEPRPNRLTSLLMVEAVCGMIASIALPVVHMVVFVS